MSTTYFETDRHALVQATSYTDACKAHYTITVYKTFFLKMNPRFRKM